MQKSYSQVSDTFLLSLEKLVVMMIEQFPTMHIKLHFLCFYSILRILVALAPKGGAFRGFLSKIGTNINRYQTSEKLNPLKV